jgi:integrase
MSVAANSADKASRSSTAWAPQDELGRLIDWAALGRLGFDASTGCFAPDADDPVFGFSECKAASCDQVAITSLGLCWRCDQFWRKAEPRADFERFCETAPERLRYRRTAALCRVCRTPGHERPVHCHGLCAACDNAIAKRGQSPDEYVVGDEQFPPATPRLSFGRCLVSTCSRFAWRARPALCEQHHSTWRSAGRPAGASFRTWCARQRSIDRDCRVVVLDRLAEGVQLEVLYGLQRAAEIGRRTRPTDVQTAVNIVRAQGVASVRELSMELITPGTQIHRFLTFTADQVTVALATPASEAAKDDWDLRVFGHIPGLLRFGLITQEWLKETAKAWAAERIDTVETPRVMQAALRALRALSESLSRNRSDGGADPQVLSRADLSAFANDLSHLEAQGRLSPFTRRSWLAHISQFLGEARAMGLSRPGRPLAGLPEEVVFRRGDRLKGVSPDEPGRALPQTVIDQLLDPAALGLLEAMYGADTRAMVELEARVGRRTGELCGLRYDCLAFDEVLDEAGQLRAAPVLIPDMPKVAIRGYRLPIDEETAEIIREQQERARARHADTPTSALALFPAVVMNPRGVKGHKVTSFGAHFRQWVDLLPELLGPGGEPYDRADIVSYSFRHSFAQRHADSGTPIDVLAELMGHRHLTTTQGYFRVTDKRKRKAVDTLAALQVDRDAKRTRPVVERLLDTEAARDAIGQVAVPFGICTEPTNVKAHGQACPFRHQCFGCTYFRSDPSFVPELRAYLTRLLADQERLRAAVPELEEWARNQAIPSAEETEALRRIIRRCEQLVADLPEDERAEVEQAIIVLRRVRAQLDTSIPVRFRGGIGQPSARLFPNLERDRRVGDDG